MDLENLRKKNTLSAIRAELRLMKPEVFESVMDKTICLTNAIRKEKFESMDERLKNKLRDRFDPGRKVRDNNDEILKEIRAERENLRIRYLQRATELMLGEASRTYGHGRPPEQSSEPSQPSRLAELPSRPAGLAAGPTMHRTIERMEVSNLDAAIREKKQEIELAEDEDELKRIQDEVTELEEQKKKMKDKVSQNEAEARKIQASFRLTKDNIHDQSWHDSRYHSAIAKGVSHSAAWVQEKKRRKATLKRKEGVADRRRELKAADLAWHEAFDSKAVKDEEFHDEALEGIETEAVEEADDGTVRVLKGKAKLVKRGQLKKGHEKVFFKSARSYRRLTQDEVSKFKTETKSDEMDVMRRKRVNIFAKRHRVMTEGKKLERRKRVKAARTKKRREASQSFYLNHPSGDRRCQSFVTTFCAKGVNCPLVHSEVDREKKHINMRQDKVMKDSSRIKLVPKTEVKEINAFVQDDGSVDEWTHVVANFDTGAAITAIPSVLKNKLGLNAKEPSARSYKTASGELLPDEGGTVINGYDNDGRGRSVNGRLVNVHRMLVSGSAVGRKNCVMLDGSAGTIVPNDGPIAEGMRKALKDLMKQHPQDAARVTKMYEQNGIYCFDLWLRHGDNASKGEQAVSPQPEDDVILDGEDDTAEQRAPKVLRGPKSPTEQEIEEHEAAGRVTFRSWCGHCVRAKGLHERHSRVDAVEKADRAFPVVGIDYFWYGQDDQEREHELPSLQVKDEHSGMMWSSVVPAKGADQFAVDFLLGVLTECGYKRIILKSDNEPAIKALKSKVQQAATCEVVLEEGKTGDKPSTGSVEVSVRETKRQCRAMKSALLEKMDIEIPDRHPIWTWLSRHANFLISRYRVGEDGRTPDERLKGKKWRRPMVVFGEQIWFRPLKSYTAKRGDLDPKLDSGVYVGTHGRNGDILVMTDKGVIKGGSVKRKALEQRWSKEGFEKLRGTPWKMRPQSAEDLDAPVAIELPEARGRLSPEPAARDAAPRNLYVTRKDVEDNPTPGCPGCIAIAVGLPARSHSSECRTLVQQRLMRTEEGKQRVLKAQKRKGEVPEEASEPHGAAEVEDIPDVDEEMHGPDAVGYPQDRVDPVGRPNPDEELSGRVDPVDRPIHEAGPESPSKRQRRPEPKGEKRAGESIEELASREPARPGEVSQEGASSSAGPVSRGGQAAESNPPQPPPA
eukprot:s510_g9.t1